MLPCLFLFLFSFLFLYMSWRTLNMQSELLSLNNSLDEFETAAASLGLWAVALARQEFNYFQESKTFTCDIGRWPPGYAKFSAKVQIKSLNKTSLEIKTILLKRSMQKELMYLIEKRENNSFAYQQVV